MMTVKPDTLAGYFSESRSWDADRLRSERRSRRLAWTVAALATLCATTAVGAVVVLTPLKTVEPFVVRVDRATGAVEVMTALTGDRPVTYDEAVSKHFLSQYVRAREGWLQPAAEENFRQVSIMSAASEQQRWADSFRPTNPASPQLVFGPSAEALIEIRAVSFIADDVANVRFRKTVRRSGGPEVSDWVATITFAYARAPMAEADRLRNPLGFQVISYRADAETFR